jgi:meso-butanediol dehydrogenase/(S,S)-butanediol dehydrogenase/diacetyl reductase
MTSDRFKEKVVVTGPRSGIGAATARRFSAEGAQVALIDRDRTSLESVANDLPSERTIHHVLDVSDSAAVEAMVCGVVEHFGRLDVIVNNAGVHGGGEPERVTNGRQRCGGWRRVGVEWPATSVTHAIQDPNRSH